MATPSIHAAKDGDVCWSEFTSSTAGLQAAIDYLAGGKGKVFVGPGTLEITTVISLHSNCHLQGAGTECTVIKRATGSLTASDAAPTGCSFIVSAFGANGSHPSAVGSASDVTISDLTIDGNQSNFPINPNTPGHFGVIIKFIDGIRLERVMVREFLQGGIKIDTGRRAFFKTIRTYNTGQYGSASDRNAIDLHDNNGTADYARDAVISDVITENTNDTHHYCDWSNVTYSNIVMRGTAQYGFELETKTARTDISRVTINGVSATGLTKEFLRLGQLSGSATTFNDILCQNVACTFGTHSGFAVRISNSSNMVVNRFKLSGSTFYNCNSGDAANVPFVFHDVTNTSTPSKDIAIVNCDFIGGAPSSTTVTSHGIDIRGNNRRVQIVGCTVRDATGSGILARTHTTACTLDGCDIIGCYVYNSTGPGVSVLGNVTASTLKNINVLGNYVEDACESTGSAGIYIGPTTGTAAMSNVSIKDNRVNQVSSTTMTRGLTLEAGGSATSDLYFIAGNEMINLGSGSDLDYANTGTHTNVHFSDPVVRGGDIASGATITLRRGTLFHVTGTTSIATLNPQVTWERRPITFIFDSTAGFTDGSNLKINGNFVATADDAIVLQYDGTSWFECSRSAN